MIEYCVFQDEVLQVRQANELRYPFAGRNEETFLLIVETDRPAILHQWHTSPGRRGDWLRVENQEAIQRYQSLLLIQSVP